MSDMLPNDQSSGENGDICESKRIIPEQDPIFSSLPPKKTTKKKNEKSFGAVLKDFLWIILIAVAISVMLKTFVVDSRVIPTLSMYPTIQVGDRIILNKLAYIGDKTPQRGDIVVFYPPAELNSKDDLIKRVIGLPGETLEIIGGVVYIDGEALDESYVYGIPDYDYSAVTIPDDCYFMMGDNRNSSLDSHLWNNPFIEAVDIRGRAIFIYWPLNRMGILK